jgi:beta-galactosidase/beta-glucuronidase
MTNIPRPEYPRPQFVREQWINLNGTWTCEFDHSRSGYDAGEMLKGGEQKRSRRLWQSTGFDQEITVPFCPESELSGIGHTDFIEQMWYHRKLEIPAEWTDGILLHFGAVDYHCDVFIDGKLVGRHAGGQVGFNFDASSFVTPGSSHDLVLLVRDDVRGYVQPSGKQSGAYHSHGCHYTRVTGIWQTVWMEPVSACALDDVQILSDLDNSAFHLVPTYHGITSGAKLQVRLLSDGEAIAEVSVSQVNGLPITLPIAVPKPWSPASPHLYDIEMELVDADGRTVDAVRTYAGLRKVHIEGDQVLLNNEPLYQRLVLDQGYYPDGIWTAPSDDALKRDIELSMAAGFNGARLHQKVFEPRFHYWADTLGYLTWGEASSWGCNAASIEGRDNFLREWREILLRDRNHPSIITWTPWNEMWWIMNEEQFGRTLNQTYELTRTLDPTRPVHTASGGAHCKTDIWSVHSYEQNGNDLARVMSEKQDANLERSQGDLGDARPHAGQPLLLDEFGGIKWQPAVQGEADWGYGDAPQSLDEFYARLAELVEATLEMPGYVGYCYTQLTDVEQEVNGIYNYDRTPKFDMERIHAIFGTLK